MEAKLWGIFSLTHPVGRGSSEASASTSRGTEALGKDFLGRTHKEHRFRAFWFFFFGVIYFLNPLVVKVQLESRTYQGREGGRVSRIPRQLWREAPGSCSWEVGPVRLPAVSGEAGSPPVQVFPAEESRPLLDLYPHRPSQRFPKRVPRS